MKIVSCVFLLLLILVSSKANEDNLDGDIEDFILQEILLDDEITQIGAESADFLRVVDRYLQGLMRRFRNKVLKLYRQMTCTTNNLCNPFQLSSAYSSIDDLSFDRNGVDLQLTRLKRLEDCVLPFDLADHSVIYMQSQIAILVAVSIETKRLYLLSLKEPGACKIDANLHGTLPDSPTLCMHSFTIDQQVNLVVIYACTSAHNFVHIYMLTDSSLEMLELIEAELVENVIDILISGSHYLCLVIDKRCQLYVWTGTTFELGSQNNFSTIGLGTGTSSFMHRNDLYLVAIGDLKSSLQSSVGVWKVQHEEELISLNMYQTLHECKAATFHLFQLGGLDFIALPCEYVPESYLYWWSGSQFLVWQSIALNLKTLSWTSVILDNGDVILMALHQNDGRKWMQAYELEDGHYKSSDVEVELLETSVDSISSISQSNLILTISNRNIGMYKLETLVQDAIKVDESDDVSEYVKQMEQLAERQETMIQSLKTDLEHYKNLSNDGSILKPIENLNCAAAENVLKTMKTRLNLIEEERKSFSTFVNLKELRVRTLVVKNVLNVSSLTLSEGNINNIDLAEMKKSVLSKTSDQVFDADVVFDGGLNAYKLKTYSMNNVNYENIAKIDDGAITFTRPQTFGDLEVNSAKVKGVVNEAKVSDWVLKKSLPKMIIHGRKSFKKLKIAGNAQLSRGKINQVDVKRFFSSVITHDDEDMNEDMHVTGNVTINSKITAVLVNGVDISNLARNIIYASKEQQFPDLRLDALNVDNLTIKGYLNDVKVEKDLLTTETDQEIDFPVIIKGNLDVLNNVEVVSRQVNSFPNWSNSVVTRCGNETIRGRKVFADTLEMDEIKSTSQSTHVVQHFHEIIVEHLTVDTLNDIEDVNDLLSNSLKRNSPNLLFHGRLFCSSLKLKGPVTEMAADKLHHRFLTVDTPQNVSLSHLFFLGDVFVNGSVQLGDNAHVNGIYFDNLKHNCLMKSGDQTLRRLELEEATFLNGANIMDYDNILHHLFEKIDWRLNSLEAKGDVHLEDDLDSQYLNGIHLDSFLSRIYSVQDHLHFFGKTFRHITVSGDVQFDSQLNGVNCDDFFKNIVRLSTDQQITGDVRVTKPVLCLNGNVNASLVNSFDLIDRLSRLAKIEEYGIVEHVHFTNGFEVLGDVYSKSLNGKNLDLLNNIILESSQDFLNTINFSGKITIGELEVRGKINGANVFDWLLLNDNRTFSGQVYFKAPTYFSNLSLNTSVTELRTKRHFNTLMAKRVVLKGLVNGLRTEKLSSLMLSRSSNQTFSSSKVVFNTNVVIDHLITENLPTISGIRLDEVIDRGLTTNTPQTINEKVHFSSISQVNFEKRITVQGDLKIDGVTSGSNFKSEFESGRGWMHIGNVIFEDKVIIQGNLSANLDIESLKVNTINNVNLKNLIENRVTLSTNQTINSPVKFETVPLLKSFKDCVERSPTVYEENINFKCRVVIEELLRSKYNLTLRL